jgi:hypothetical protein
MLSEQSYSGSPMLPALKNRATNVTHMRTVSGEAYCGATWSGLGIVCEVRYRSQINCARCRADRAFKIWESAVGGDLNDEGVRFVALTRPPREDRRRK